MRLHQITARDIPDAWFQCLYDVQDENLARIWKIDQGSYAGQRRMEFYGITVQIRNPCFGNLSDRIPRMPESMQGVLPDPVDDPAEEYVTNYFLDYLFSRKVAIGEQYTYGSRIMARVDVQAMVNGDPYHLMESIRRHFPEQIQQNCLGESVPQYYVACAYLMDSPGTNQVLLQVAGLDDAGLPDPPCLRHIDCRVIDGVLHWFIYFRSWDLWGGFPANLAGLSLLMEQMCSDTGLKPGQFICHSKGLHLYDHGWDLARVRTGR